MKLLEAVINKWFCLHKWDNIAKSTYYIDAPEHPWRTKVLLCCNKCGKLKHYNV